MQDFTAQTELEWMQKHYPEQAISAYVQTLETLPSSSIFLLDLVSRQQLSMEFQIQTLRLLWEHDAPSSQASAAACIAEILRRDETGSHRGELSSLVRRVTLGDASSSRLAALVLTELNMGADAIATALLASCARRGEEENAVFFAKQLTRFHLVEYTANTCHALALIAKGLGGDEEVSSVCISRCFSVTLRNDFAPLALQVLQQPGRATQVFRAAIDFLLQCKCYPVETMLFLVENSVLWPALNCARDLAELASGNLECADLLGLFLLERGASASADARALAMGALCHTRWFSAQEAIQVSNSLLDSSSHQQSLLSTSALWAIQQSLECYQQLSGAVFFGDAKSFGRLLASLLAGLKLDCAKESKTRAMALDVLRLLLEQEEAEINVMGRRSNRFSFIFSQLAELLMRGGMDQSIREEEEDLAHAQLLQLLVRISASDVAGLVSWILSTQMRVLREGWMVSRNGGKRGAEHANRIGACLGPLLVLHTCILRLNSEAGLIISPAQQRECANIALHIWSNSSEREMEQVRMQCIRVMRSVPLAGNYARVIECELMCVQQQQQHSSPELMAGALSLCFTRSEDEALLAHVRALARSNGVSAKSPSSNSFSPPVVIAAAAVKAWGEMLVARRATSLCEVREWLELCSIAAAAGVVEQDEILDILRRYEGPTSEVAHLALDYLVSITKLGPMINARTAVAGLRLVCVFGRNAPFAARYAEWQRIFACAPEGQAALALEAMRQCGM